MISPGVMYIENAKSKDARVVLFDSLFGSAI